MNVRLMVVLALLVLGALGFAAYAGPFSRPSQPAATAWRSGRNDIQIRVEVDPRVDTPVLVIPRTLLVTTKTNDQRSAAPGSPIIGGLALSAAFVVGGLWYTGRIRRGTGALVALVLLGAGTGTLLADVPSPWWSRREPRPPRHLELPAIDPRLEELPLPASVSLPKSMKMELVETGEVVRLLIPGKPAAPGSAPVKIGTPRAPEVPRQ